MGTDGSTCKHNMFLLFLIWYNCAFFALFFFFFWWGLGGGGGWGGGLIYLYFLHVEIPNKGNAYITCLFLDIIRIYAMLLMVLINIFWICLVNSSLIFHNA